MHLAFESFKEYLLKLDSIQINNKDAYRTKYEDLELLRSIVNHIKLVPAGEKEKSLLQYGTFFDGQHLFYEEETAVAIAIENQHKFNQIILNHIFHFMTGAQFLLSGKPSTSTIKWYLSNVALYFAHFNISKVKPRYANSIRGVFFEKHHVNERGYGLIFAPHPETANYFYENYETGEIKLPSEFRFTRTSKFDCPEGIVYIATMTLPYLTMGSGIAFQNKQQKQIALLKDEDSNLQRVDFKNKRARDIKGYKEVMEALAGELDDDLYDY